MADNVTLPGTGAAVRSDDVGGVQVQVVKVALGADGAEDTLIDSGQQTMANSLPVALASDQSDVKITLDSEAVVLGAGSAAIGKLAANSGVDIGDVDVTSLPAPLNVSGGGTEATALRVTLASDSTGVVSVDDNGGALTVDGTVTANLSATDNAVLDAIVAALPAALAAGGGLKVEGVAGGVAQPVSIATVPSHAVTNAGTFATQIDGAALTALQLIDNMAVAVDGNYLNVNANIAGTDMVSGSGTATGALRVELPTNGTGVIATVGAVTAITNALPAGTNAIGKLAANSGVDIGDVDVTSLPALAAGTNVIGKVQPFSAMLEGGLTELVGINEQVDQNDYSGSIGVALGGTYSGEILAVAFYATEDGTGAVQDSAGILYVLDADPSISSGDTAMSAAARVTVIGKIAIGAADWDADANGGLAYVSNLPIPFHALANLYFVWKHLDATGLNDAAGDDEQLEFNFWWKRES